MPELPEVETVVRGLRPILLGHTLTNIRINAPRNSVTVSRSLGNVTLANLLERRSVLAINRRGKNILIALDGDLTLWVHLKMTGHFLWTPKATAVDKHDLVIFDLLPDQDYHLRFNDYRRFGRLRLYRNDELWLQKGLVELGPEPLEISSAQFIELCHRRPRQIKQALLDQSFLAGLGNIYADESLYCSRLHPKRLTTSISKPKLLELHGHIQRMLKRAIRLHGTSVDSYSGVNGRTGGFQKYLLAYGNEGEPCGRCGAGIVRQKIGSRSAHFCPRCQKEP